MTTSNGGSASPGDIALREKGDMQSPPDAEASLLPRKEPIDNHDDTSPDAPPKQTDEELVLGYYLYRPDAEGEPPEDGNRQMSFKQAGEAFGNRSSLVGFTQYHESIGLVKKVFWVIVLLLSLGALLYYTSALIIRYYNNDITISQRIETHRTIKFPAVTICNKNMLTRDPGTGIIEGRNQSKYADFFAAPNVNKRKGHQQDDFIVEAFFGSQKLEPSEFECTASGLFGNCYTFNTYGTASSRRALPDYGLQLILNLESYKYNRGADCAPPDFVAAMLKVHNPQVETLVEEGGVILSPNTISRISLKKTEVERLGGKYGDCIHKGDIHGTPESYYKGIYSKENCESTCLQREVLKRCCCYIKTMKRNLDSFNDSWNTCEGLDKDDPRYLDGNKCVDCEKYSSSERRFPSISYCEDSDKCFHDVWKLYDQGDIKCSECYEECKETVYDVTTDVAAWPAADYMDYTVIPELKAKSHLIEQLEKYTFSRNITRDTVKENLLRVEVYFESLTTTYIKEVAVVGEAEFIAELESTAGFWVGWSMWTVFQFLEFITDAFVICIRRCRGRAGEPGDSRRPSEASASV